MTRPKRFQLAVVTALFASSAAAQSATDLGASVSTDVGGAVGSVSSGVTDAVSDVAGGGSTGRGSGGNTSSGGATEGGGGSGSSAGGSAPASGAPGGSTGGAAPSKGGQTGGSAGRTSSGNGGAGKSGNGGQTASDSESAGDLSLIGRIAARLGLIDTPRVNSTRPRTSPRPAPRSDLPFSMERMIIVGERLEPERVIELLDPQLYGLEPPGPGSSYFLIDNLIILANPETLEVHQVVGALNALMR